jgi:hypothetical protein
MPAYEVTLTPEDRAPFRAEELIIAVSAADEMEATGRAYRMLKRQYGAGTTAGNPMWWRSTITEKQR